MKKLFILLAASFAMLNVMAEDSIQVAAMQSAAQSLEGVVAALPKKADVNFKLYPTQNMYIFLLLDTRNGRIWLEQWGTKHKDRVEAILSLSKQTYGAEEIPGRFELYPTTNIYNFIMVDQVNGNTWQVQWSTEPSERMVVRIN